ncbi:MAG: MurT ligase domain-containing protein [Firmicutes bacterium]|nr:MurT ligase domain-containing protein [Bacillota bacterium]
MRLIAIIIGKILMLFSRMFKIGGGSSFPGLVALAINPRLIASTVSKLKYGTVVITGTNGKTTTSKHLSSILNYWGLKVVHNRTGSNLMRGIASALIEQSTIFGKPRGDIGLFEVDEAAMPVAVANLNPRVVLVTNLFRDQLDRYGELDKIAAVIAGSVEKLENATIVLNADDPLVASLAKVLNTKIKVKYFGLNDNGYVSRSRASVDTKDCLICRAELKFEKRYYGHLGIYSCPNGDFKRPKPDFEAGNISLHGVKNSSFFLTNGQSKIDISLNLSGIFNIYNSLAAYSAAVVLGVDGETIKEALNSSSAAFGRMEKFVVRDREVYLLLVKNPIGLTQIIETLNTDANARNFMIILNDNFADGTDISWIWDADVYLIKDNFKFFYVSGVRAQDMALRLKYEDFDMSKIVIINDVEDAFADAVNNTPSGETLYVLATYTGMLQLRNYLTRKGVVEGFWRKVA